MSIDSKYARELLIEIGDYLTKMGGDATYFNYPSRQPESEAKRKTLHLDYLCESGALKKTPLDRYALTPKGRTMYEDCKIVGDGHP